MVKKLQKMAEKKASAASGLLDGQLAGTIKDSAQQIWLAGLGAFSKAQAEGGKVFEALVKEGVSLQRKTQAVAEEKIGAVTDRMSNVAGDVSSKAGQHWDKLESIFEQRTSRAMGKLGVPTRQDVDALIARIDALAAQVAALSKSPASRAAPARKAVARLPAPKRPAVKKAAVKKAAAPAPRAARKRAA